MWMHQYGLGGIGVVGMILGGLIWLAILIGIVLLIVWLARQVGRPTPNVGPRSDDAIEILKQRYARGELNREQFEQMKKDLLS